MGEDNNYQAGVPGSPGQKLTKLLQDWFLQLTRGNKSMGPSKPPVKTWDEIGSDIAVSPDNDVAKALAKQFGKSPWLKMPPPKQDDAVENYLAGQSQTAPTSTAAPSGMGKAAPAQPAAPVNPLHQLPDLKKLSDQELASLAAGGIQAAEAELNSRFEAQGQ